MKLPQKQSKLGSYLTVALGAGAAATSAEAAITVTTYSGATDGDTSGLAVGRLYHDGALAERNNGTLMMGMATGYISFWRAGETAGALNATSSLTYYFVPTQGFYLGAQNGSNNYMSVDIDGDGYYESVFRLMLDPANSLAGYVMAKATSDASSYNLSIADGSAAILAAGAVAATPEPAGFLLGGVPALVGAGALLRRRVRPGSGLGLMALGAEGVRARREGAAAA